MIPHKLTLRNFMCYRDDVPPLHFDGINVVCLSGENGAGKSTLLDAMTWALWGKARSKSDDELIALGQDDMEVDFEFVLDGTLRRVIRRRTRGKRGQTIVDFQVCEEAGAWRRISGDGVRDTDAQIAAALRMNYDTFINSAFLLQGRADEFTNRKPADRKQVLADILSLSDYEALEERAKIRRKLCADELRSLEGIIEDHERQIARRPFLVDEVARAEAAAEHADDQVATREKLEQQFRAESERLRRLADDRRALDQTIFELTATHLAAQKDLLEGEARVAEYEQIVDLRPQIEMGVAELQGIESRLEQFDRWREEVVQLNGERKAWSNALERCRADLRHEQEVAATDVLSLRETAAPHDALVAELVALEAKRGHFKQLHAALASQREAAATLEDRIEHIRTLDRRAERLRMQLERATQAATLRSVVLELPGLRAELKHARAALAEIDVAAKDHARQVAALRAATGVRGRQEADCAALEKEGKGINALLHDLEAGAVVCPECRQSLVGEAREQMAADYGGRRDDLRARYKAAKVELSATEASIVEGEATIAQLEQTLGMRAAVQEQVATLDARLQQARKAEQELADTPQSSAEDLATELGVTEAGLTECGNLAVAQAELAAGRAAVRTIEQELRGEIALEKTQASLEERLRVATDAMERIPDAEAREAQLTQRLAGEDYGHDERTHMLEYQAALDVIQSAGYSSAEHEHLRQTRLDHLHWRDKIPKLNHALGAVAHERAAVQRNRDQAERLAIELDDKRRALATLDVTLAGRRGVESDLQRALDELQKARADQRLTQIALGSARQELATCDRVAQVLEGYRGQHAALSDQHGIYDELAQAFGKKGIQAMLIETAIPELEHEANTLLARMTDNQMHLSFETQRDSKKGDTIETLDIRIADGLGTRDYAMFSGGEAFRVNFAVRIALSKLLARRADANLKTLVIDEGFGTQDSHGRDRIVEAINAISPDFERIIVITHIQELKDLFPTHIEVTKGIEGSSWRIV